MKRNKPIKKTTLNQRNRNLFSINGRRSPRTKGVQQSLKAIHSTWRSEGIKENDETKKNTLFLKIPRGFVVLSEFGNVPITARKTIKIEAINSRDN